MLEGVKLPSQGSCFGGYTFLHTPVTDNHIGKVVDKLAVLILVESGAEMGLSHCQTDRVCEALAQRTRRHLDAMCHVALWVAWSSAKTQNEQLSLYRDEQPYLLSS